MSYRAIQTPALLLAIVLYGAFGSPTPDHPGVFEAALAALLFVSVGVSGLWLSLRLNLAAPLWVVTGQALFVFGLTVPLIGGVVGGHDLSMIARDMAAFIFVVLPLFFIRQSSFTPVLYAVMGLGLLFALRSYFDLPYVASGHALFYLANAPTVLFAAIAFAGFAIDGFVRRFSVSSIFRAAALLGLSALCLLPMIETQQRASLGAFVMSIGLLLLVLLWRRPRRSSFVLVAVLGAAFAYSGQLLGVFEDLSRKTALVGVNMRAEEWAAVWQEVSSSPMSVIFGRGWGAMFSSPAVADITVNYTHGLASSLLLKTGLMGLALGMTYLFLLGKDLYPLFKKSPVLSVSLAVPVVIDVFLYASFKSLDFGLMLLLMSLLIKTHVFYGEDRRDAIASGEGLLYSEDVAKQS